MPISVPLSPAPTLQAGLAQGGVCKPSPKPLRALPLALRTAFDSVPIVLLDRRLPLTIFSLCAK